MKDKRQKIAFAWPGYPGDPFSYFSYMYAAAASGYVPPSPSIPSNPNPVLPPVNPLTAAVRLATEKLSSSHLLNGSTDTTTSYSSSASSPTSSSSSPKHTHQRHSPSKPSFNFALPAMGLAPFINSSVNERSNH